MDGVTDLWLAGTRNLDASDWDALLDHLETIEETATEGMLHMTKADYEAFNTAGTGYYPCGTVSQDITFSS